MILASRIVCRFFSFFTRAIKMKILLASPRGFCAGVNRAIQTLAEIRNRAEGPIYVLHEIVHNFWVVDSFRKQGVRFVESLSDVPPGETVLFSAHGISPAVRKEAARRRLQTIDATCPLVQRIHEMSRRFAADGYQILLIGHAGHQEVIGTLGEAPERMTLVSSLEEIDRLDFPPDTKLVCLTQTTLSHQNARQIIDALKRRFPDLVEPPNSGICFATRHRQEAVESLLPEADLLLVVGSRNSSNSRRLAELGEAARKPARLIDGPADLRSDWFSGNETVLLTAGASAPEEVVQKTVEWLAERFDATVQSRVVHEENVVFQPPGP